MDLFTAHHACVHIYNQDTEELELRVWKGGSPEFLNSISQMKLGEGLVGMVAELGEALALNIDDFPRGTRSVVAADGIGCVAAIPMKSRGRLLGVLGVASEETNRFSQADLNLLGAITGQVSMAIENVLLFKVVQERRPGCLVTRHCSSAGCPRTILTPRA